MVPLASHLTHFQQLNPLVNADVSHAYIPGYVIWLNSSQVL